MKFRTKLLAAAFAFAMATPASAALVNVTGPLSSEGTAAAIIGAPGDVNDDAAFNTGMQGFNEVQSFTLLADLNIDGGIIGLGTTIDSQMIFLNTESQATGSANVVSHENVVWTFDGIILGTMSNSNGSLEVASSGFLGAAGTAYPNSAFAARGLESSGSFADSIAVVGNVLTASFFVTEPGDWIRVITQSVPGTITVVPLPAALPLYGTGLAIMGFIGWRRKRKAAA